jgi:cell division protein FtsW (lipid II flippase)
MQRDWRTNPALNAVSVILSVIGLVISSFSDISMLAKVIVMVVGLLACLYVIFSGKPRATTSASKAQKTDKAFSAPSHQFVQLPSQPTDAKPVEHPSWKDRVESLLIVCVMFGVPGVLLFRSTVGWQHVVGIILLVCAIFVGIITAFPEAEAVVDRGFNALFNAMDRFNDRMERVNNKLDQYNDRMDQISDRMDRVSSRQPGRSNRPFDG